MTGEQIRRRGLVQAAVGLVLVAWVVVVAAMAEVENSQVLVATAVSGSLVCLCAAAGGVVAARLVDAEAAARSRHVFLVLEGAALAIFFPFYWFTSGVEYAGRTGDFALGVAIALAVPVAAGLVLALRCSRAVHRIVVDEYGPLVADSGAGAPAQRIRVLGTVLVTAGVVLSVGVVAIVVTTPSRWLVLDVFGLAVTLMPVLLGVSLGRVTDVYSARRRNVGSYLLVPFAGGFAVTKFASLAGAAGMLFGALVFGAILLLVIALLAMREYTGEWDRPWREPKRKVSR
jgi:hypothetical protein